MAAPACLDFPEPKFTIAQPGVWGETGRYYMLAEPASEMILQMGR